MSEIPYVNRLGDALDVLGETEPNGAAARPHRRRLPRLPHGRSRLLAGLAAVLIGGGVATAGTLLSASPTQIAAFGLTCNNGTFKSTSVSTANVQEGDRSPQSACATVVHIPARRLIACASPAGGVSVYVRDGKPRECERAGGQTPVPAGIERAAAHISRLTRDLNHLQASENCFRPRALVAATQATLNALGFHGWRAVLYKLPHQMGSGWPCGQYPGSGARWSDAASALTVDPHPKTVAIVTGMSLHDERALATPRVSGLLADTGARCYSLTDAQSLVAGAARATFGAATHVEFAARREPRSTTLALGRQARYLQGCATLVAAGLTPTGAFQALIWQRGWPAMGTGNAVPASAYKPTLPAKP